MDPAGRIVPLKVVEDAMEPGPQEEGHLFKLSPASAEQVTIQIRSMLERAWEYIAIAYQGRAYLALGYETWDEYVDDRLAGLRLTVPREERAEAVAALSNAKMSLRAIAKVLGVSPATAYRDLADAKPETDDAAEDALPVGVRGRDGKQYPKRRKAAVVECALCGETHPASMLECPWDLFAQGRGPRPGAGQDPDVAPPSLPSPSDAEPDEQPSGAMVVQLVPAKAIGDAVTRAVCIVDELAVLPELVDEIEASERSPRSNASNMSVRHGVRELIEHLRVQAELISDLLPRLERIARTR